VNLEPRDELVDGLKLSVTELVTFGANDDALRLDRLAREVRDAERRLGHVVPARCRVRMRVYVCCKRLCRVRS
jgi:hypothetical protein